MTVPMLDEMIQLAAAEGAREVVIGMAHRGRLNVLAHNLGRAYETIFREFEGASSIEAVTTIPQGGTGDVKYHHGAQGTYQCGDAAERARAAGVQPVAPRVRRPGRRGRHARRPDLAPGHARDAGHQRRGADHPARRRRLPRPGRRRGDVQPAGARRLHGRRLAAPDHRTTRSASRPTRTTRAPRAGPRTSRRASTSRSSTSTPTTSPPASPPCGSRSRSARSSATTS